MRFHNYVRGREGPLFPPFAWAGAIGLAYTEQWCLRRFSSLPPDYRIVEPRFACQMAAEASAQGQAHRR